jgi:hypothetical protein
MHRLEDSQMEAGKGQSIYLRVDTRAWREPAEAQQDADESTHFLLVGPNDGPEDDGMKLESTSVAGSKIALIVGWVISAIPILMMGVGGSVMAITNPQMVEKGIVEHGYPAHAAHVILGLEIGCAVVYAIPQTAVLGAILLTGYLGGATATHVRVEESQWFVPVIVAVFVWLGVFLRDKRLRALLPLRR